MKVIAYCFRHWRKLFRTYDGYYYCTECLKETKGQHIQLKENMTRAIESMQGRKPRGHFTRAREYGFVWGLMWVADKIGFFDVVTLANKVMKEIDEELGELR